MLRMCPNESRVLGDPRSDLILFKALEFLLLQQKIQLTPNLARNSGLLPVGTKNDAGVLRSPIVALPILGGGIVKGEEEADQFFEELRCRIVQYDIQDFDIAGVSRTHLLVVGILERVLGVDAHKADLGTFYGAREFLLEVLDHEFFRAPITTCTQGQGRRDVGSVAIITRFSSPFPFGYGSWFGDGLTCCATHCYY